MHLPHALALLCKHNLAHYSSFSLSLAFSLSTLLFAICFFFLYFSVVFSAVPFFLSFALYSYFDYIFFINTETTFYARVSITSESFSFTHHHRLCSLIKATFVWIKRNICTKTTTSTKTHPRNIHKQINVFWRSHIKRRLQPTYTRNACFISKRFTQYYYTYIDFYYRMLFTSFFLLVAIAMLDWESSIKKNPAQRE